MTVAIGVTGHRMLAEVDRIAAGVDEAVGLLEHAAPGEWTVITALAEGADRLVAERLLRRRGTRLVVILPMAAEEYERDFADARSRAAFRRLLARGDEVVVLRPRPSREAAYVAAGLAVLERCDILIAVWDGQDELGPGGTAAVVAEARRRAKPVVWVHAGNRTRATDEPVSIGAEQGAVTHERLVADRADEGGSR